MKNALVEFKRDHKLTFEEIAKLCGIPNKGLVHLHCTGKRNIAAESAIKYHKGLGIPLCELRPDLWPCDEQPALHKEPCE